jgi:hypothetical protein
MYQLQECLDSFQLQDNQVAQLIVHSGVDGIICARLNQIFAFL